MEQPKKTSEVLTAWDQMLVAKAHPGQLNTSYVAGMNNTNLPTTTFSMSNSFKDVNTYGSSYNEPLGTESYTLIMWCPAATSFFGDGSHTSIATDTRLGGLIIKQVSESDLGAQFISKQSFQEVQTSYTMPEVYGSDQGSFSSGGFVWAAEATMNILTPAANLIGSYYKGTLQFGQLPEEQSKGLTLKELIAISGDVEIMKAQFHLRSGIVNHDLVYESQARHGTRIPDDVHSTGIDRQTNRSIMSSCFAGELVNYVVLQNVAQNITSGQKALYELQVNIKGNSVFWGKAEDTIANNLFKSNRTSHNPMPGLLAGIS